VTIAATVAGGSARTIVSVSRALIAVLVATAALAPAVSAGGSLPYLIVSPTAVHRGHSVALRGWSSHCPLGDPVLILSRAFVHRHDFAGVPAVYAKVLRGGHFAATMRIPPRRAAGRYRVTARCGGGNLGVNVPLDVRR
jgi:hypothetical protein